MKKIKFLTLAVAILLSVGNVCAQTDNTFCFLDANGNEVKDGSTVTFYAEKETILPGIFGPLQAKFNLQIKNTTNSTGNVAVHLITKEISSGDVTCCLGTQCTPLKGNKDYISESCLIDAGESINFPTEWFPDEGNYGNADFTVQLLNSEKGGSLDNVKGFGPKINIHCIYADPAGIADMESDKNATVICRYDSKGNKLSAPAKGLNIVKLSNGEIRKIIVK